MRSEWQNYDDVSEEKDVSDKENEQPETEGDDELLDELRSEETSLALAVWGLPAIESYITKKRSDLNQDAHNTWWEKQDPALAEQQRATLKEEVKTLIANQDRIGLLWKAWDIIDMFFGSFLWWAKGYQDALFSWSSSVDELLKNVTDMPSEIDFSTIPDDELKKLKEEMDEKVISESDTFQKLHRLYISSRASDEIAQREGEINKDAGSIERICRECEAGDVIALWNREESPVGAALTLASGSPMAHVWIIWKTSTWELTFIESTIWESVFNPLWGKVTLLSEYLENSAPRAVVVMRPDENTFGDRANEIAEKARHMVEEEWVIYDMFGWALADIKGNADNNDSYNCGEFVEAVLTAVAGKEVMPKEKNAIPGEYLHTPHLKPVYMEWCTEA